MPGALLGIGLLVLAELSVSPTGYRAATEVRAAEVEVLVLDRRGRPVLDLEERELTLLVNGEKTPIDWVLSPVPLPRTGAIPLANPSLGEPVVVRSRRQHSTVFVVDEVHLDWRSRINGLKAIAQFLKGLPEAEEAALVDLDVEATLVQEFTTDREKLGEKALRLTSRLPSSRSLAEMGNSISVALDGSSLGRMANIFDGLADRPEPKTVYILSGTFLVAGLRANSACLSGLCRRDELFSFLEPARRVVDAALAARATVVAINPEGLTMPFPAGPSLLPDTPGRNGVGDSFAYLGDTYALVAEATGGARRGMSNRPDLLFQSEADLLASRYRIGFTPTDRSDVTRAIEVRVSRKNVRIRTAVGQRSVKSKDTPRGTLPSRYRID